MKTKFTNILGAVFSLLLISTTNAATQVYDLKADWSDTQNPNGTWSYRNAINNLLPNIDFPWGFPSDGPSGIRKTTSSSVIAGVIELGDIAALPGIGGGVKVRWTAPTSGTINISGNIWDGTGSVRDGDIEIIPTAWWTLSLDGNGLSGVSDCVLGSRGSPTDLSAVGSGGAAAFQNIPVAAGDQIDLLFLPDGTWSVGINLTITLTHVDPIIAIENLALDVAEMNLQNGISNSLDAKWMRRSMRWRMRM